MNTSWREVCNMSRSRAVFSLFVLLVIGALAGPSPLFAWIQVGDEVEAVFESSHPYVGQGTADIPVRQDVIQVPGASYISVHFDKFNLAAGDRVVLSDPAGDVQHVYENLGYMDKGGDFWAISVAGDTLVVSLYAQGKGPAQYGYRIDRYAHGYPLADLPGSDSPEAVCGTVDYQDAVCYETSESDAYQKSRAVVRLLKNGSAHCTGWLVSCDNHIFTNEHCVTSQTELNQIEFQFMYQKPGCGSGTATVELQLQGGTFIQDNADLDYCLLIPTLDGNDPQSVYGYIQIDNRLPDIDERMYIVNHPSGQPKKLSLESTHAQDQSGYCEVYSTDEPPCAGGPGDIGYYCDTEGGSSGSPVLSAVTNKAIALHHCANCPNRGVPVTAICEDLEGVIPTCSGCVSECFDDDGDGYGNPGTPLCTYPGEDCDDGNPAVHPGVVEGPPGDPLCGDGVDNDCDGAADLVDIGCVTCVDGDGDGYGVQASAYCTYPEEDCDDTNSDVNPGTVEGPYDDPTCEDGLDNDCDGSPDLGDMDCIEFYTEALVPQDFTGGGTAMSWGADDACWSYALPFSFPFFTVDYTSVYVCSNGFMDFTSNDSSYSNSEAGLKARTMIAVLWDDLKTNDVGDDIYIHQPSADSVAIRWDGKTYSGSLPVDVEVILYESGVIQFNYGEGNTGLTPTIGISKGDGTFFYLSPHDGAASLTLADSDRYVPVGLVCNDVDGDGYGLPASIICTHTGEDCDDGDPDVNPGADEICDGIDNNCAGGVDEEPAASADCDNALFCDGAETCAGGTCQAGTDPCPDDGLFCTGVEGCDEEGDLCTATGDPCVDANPCTEDLCDDVLDVCENPCAAVIWTDACCGDAACTAEPVCEVPSCDFDEDCDDGQWCNGAETCVDNLCALGADPCPDDGLFCNGAESCDEAGEQCLHDGDPCVDGNPCTDDLCDEGGDVCENTCNAVDWTDACCSDAACSGDPVCDVPCLDNDGDGYGDPASPECTYPEEDCDDSNDAVNPGAAEICNAGGVDEDCDGLTDSADPDCNAYAAVANAEASIYGSGSLAGSGAFNELVLVILPMGFVVWLRRLRRRNR